MSFNIFYKVVFQYWINIIFNSFLFSFISSLDKKSMLSMSKML